MLNTSIYIYSENYHSWQLFGKDGTFINDTKPNENSIYITHINNNHYQVVIEIE